MKQCSTCPFNYSEEAAQVQNYGCLPTPEDILRYKDEHNHEWRCHSDEAKPCKGLFKLRKTENVNPILYSKWYQGEYKHLE